MLVLSGWLGHSKMEYNLVIGTGSIDKNGFMKAVNDMMKQGWRPQGGIVVTGSSELVQAMVRDHNNPSVTYDLLRN
jgi:hypothetical protein